MALYALHNNVTYFYSLRVEHIPKGVRIFVDESIVTVNIFII